MVWARLEDNYPRNRKVVALSDAAFRLDVSAICWSNATGADGRIYPHELQEIRAKATRRHADELVEAGRWHKAGDPCPHAGDTCPPSTADGGGWVIHDIWGFQKSRDQVEAERKAKAERQARWLAKQKQSKASRNASRDASQDATRDTSRDTPVDGPEDGPEDVAPSPPRPARPYGAGAGTNVPAAPPAAVSGRAAAGGEEQPTPGPVAPLRANVVDERAIAARAAAERAEMARLAAERAEIARRGAEAARAALRRPAR